MPLKQNFPTFREKEMQPSMHTCMIKIYACHIQNYFQIKPLNQFVFLIGWTCHEFPKDTTLPGHVPCSYSIYSSKSCRLKKGNITVKIDSSLAGEHY